MLTVAVLIPRTDGSKCMVKVVLPLVAATEGAGWTVTLKSAALVPLRLTLGVPERVRTPLPVFLMVNILSILPPLTAALPKSVLSEDEGVISPLVMAVELPSTLISGTGTRLPLLSSLAAKASTPEI